MFASYTPHDEFSALVYGEQNPATMQFIRNRFEQAQSMFINASQTFMDHGKKMLEYFNGDEAIRRARAALRQVSNIFRSNDVHYLDTVEAMQCAQTTMQRWIMACPEIRTEYHKQRIDGYSDSYVDVDPSSVGKQHLDWRMVNTGILEFIDDAEADQPDWKTSIYFEDGLIAEGDRPLLFNEKVEIRRTWDRALEFLAAGGEDPTSIYGNKL